MWRRARFGRGSDRCLRREYQAKHHKAVDCLTKDREALLAFFDFPAEHWDHLRTTNPIESVFATVRHRTARTKGSLSSTTARLMVFKLVIAASKTWRRLKGTNHLPKIVAGVLIQRRHRGSRSAGKPRRLIAPRHLNSCIAHVGDGPPPRDSYSCPVSEGLPLD